MSSAVDIESFPQKLLSQIDSLNPSTRQQMLDQIVRILGSSVVEVIDSHNTPSAVLIFTLGRKKYIIKAEFGTETNTVKKEIDWYSKVGSHLSYVPRYISAVKTETLAALILAHIKDLITLDKISISPEVDPKNVLILIEKSLTHLNTLFNSNPKKQVSVSKANMLFIDRLAGRIKQAKSYKYLKELLNLKSIYVNGERFPNISYYVSDIYENRKLLEYVTPTLHGIIHGDLHCGNILVDKNFNLYFVDPNGNLSLPVEYDYGKIFHSIHGGYGSIMANRYSLKKIRNGEYEFSVDVPDCYTYSFDEIRKKLESDLFIRGLYLEALHFATMLPHHARNERETTALFLRGITLFRELFTILGEK